MMEIQLVETCLVEMGLVEYSILAMLGVNSDLWKFRSVIGLRRKSISTKMKKLLIEEN